MKKAALFVTSCLILAGLMPGVNGAAKEPVRVAAKKPRATDRKDDPARAAQLAALQQSVKAFREVFNRGDAKAVAALWTEDGNYIDESGKRFEGRDAIEKEYAS